MRGSLSGLSAFPGDPITISIWGICARSAITYEHAMTLMIAEKSLCPSKITPSHPKLEESALVISAHHTDCWR